jgi:hypothetical protein
MKNKKIRNFFKKAVVFVSNDDRLMEAIPRYDYHGDDDIVTFDDCDEVEFLYFPEGLYVDNFDISQLKIDNCVVSTLDGEFQARRLIFG